jgi:hypothetical protein
MMSPTEKTNQKTIQHLSLNISNSKRLLDEIYFGYWASDRDTDPGNSCQSSELAK